MDPTTNLPLSLGIVSADAISNYFDRVTVGNPGDRQFQLDTAKCKAQGPALDTAKCKAQGPALDTAKCKAQGPPENMDATIIEYPTNILRWVSQWRHDHWLNPIPCNNVGN